MHVLIFALLLAASTHGTPAPRWAYASIFYEGTPLDDHYLISLRVMMRSIERVGSALVDAERVVLVDSSVRASSIATMERDGLRVVRRSAIANPFASARKLQGGGNRWSGVFLKLAAWDLVEYDAVVLLDADNVALEPLDELFTCPAALCAVFMQACRFHSGMLVVRPDRAEYARLRAALDDESTRTSFDGADQGFLDAIYGGAMRAAPRFAALETAGAPARAGLGASLHTTHRALRLEVGWNLPHTYWLLGGLDWSAARRGRWRETPASRIPAASLAFPIAPALKPWHWWSVALLDSQWGWHFYRAQLRGAASAAGASAAQWGAVLAAYCASRWAQRRAARRAQHRSAQRRVRHGTAAMTACFPPTRSEDRLFVSSQVVPTVLIPSVQQHS